MIVYLDPKLVGKDNFNTLVERYPEIEFVTNIDRKNEIEVLIPFNPNYVMGINVLEYPNLKWIQYFSAGFDGVDLSHLKANGILFSNAQEIYSKAIAEDVFSKILFFNRSFKHYLQSMKEKKWQPIPNHIELTNSTALILGVGSIGKELAKRFKAFEMTVIGYRRNAKKEANFDKIITLDTDLNTELCNADYVILALPLNEETESMFDKSKLQLMKKDSLLINVARGKIVNQDDLYHTLKNKQIRGAGLDVFDPEPLPSNNPLWELDNVFITPHNASSSIYMQDRLLSLIIMNLDLYLDNKAVNYQIV
ncbi:Glyoxylate/hydroxypyruvate reductase B [Candidatus Izimaplasma bacterium HR1]|jgi:phosphoglycerate dehydrogenase-like enzyme|uniref:D-2-hydroxyacid dehydrogenase n=1 Tax=Candidatus Izimoplasma sp. HR1 TaxID=1541959 RepID=UPI0004F64467|nr:Glyoxylate/hydroxypyruvate reductase B [Candidatus Izimaplasma bacterium HR1]